VHATIHFAVIPFSGGTKYPPDDLDILAPAHQRTCAQPAQTMTSQRPNSNSNLCQWPPPSGGTANYWDIATRTRTMRGLESTSRCRPTC